MKFLRRLDRAIAAAETALLVVLLGVMVLLDFTQVILRNFFSSGIIWADTFLRHMVLWVAFLGASLAVQERKHINIDVLTRFMSDRGKRIARIATDLFAALVSFAFLKASVGFVSSEITNSTILLLSIPTWYFELIIPIGYGMLTFRFCMKTVDDLIAVKRPAVTSGEVT
jgi:TRAP-type C4-dicarboxylate transport system permease small subunit